MLVVTFIMRIVTVSEASVYVAFYNIRLNDHQIIPDLTGLCETLAVRGGHAVFLIHSKRLRVA